MVLRYLWPAIVWSFIILTITLLPGRQLPNVHFVGIDKVVHLVIFAPLMLFLLIGLYKWSQQTGSLRPYVLISFLYCACVGILIEVLQQYIPGRSFSMFDIAADLVGVALGYFAYRILKKRYA